MQRLLSVILLSLCVLAMPSYAAIACGTPCADSIDAHEHDCCPEIAAVVGQDADGSDAPHDSKHSDGGRHHHCAAPCCGFVAHALGGAMPSIEDRPLADSLLTGAVVRESGSHEAIFHPPRM